LVDTLTPRNNRRRWTPWVGDGRQWSRCALATDEVPFRKRVRLALRSAPRFHPRPDPDSIPAL